MEFEITPRRIVFFLMTIGAGIFGLGYGVGYLVFGM